MTTKKKNDRASLPEIILINKRLETALEIVSEKTDEKPAVCRYIDANNNDATIAAELGVSPVSVQSVRKQMFGQLAIRRVAAEKSPGVAAASNVGSRKESYETETQGLEFQES
jgi:hypothetical protein